MQVFIGFRFPAGSLFALLLLAGTLMLTTGCERVQQARDAASNVATLTKAASSMEKTMNDANARMVVRRERGDTLAIPYKELQGYLPAEVEGYKRVGEPEGSQMGMTGMTYSMASQKYQMGEGESAKTLNVSIVDYNAAGAVYAGATAMLGSGFAAEDENERMQSTDLGIAGVKALETYNKKQHQATIAAGISDRFLVTVEADKQDDTELVKSAVKALDLSKFAER